MSSKPLSIHVLITTTTFTTTIASFSFASVYERELCNIKWADLLRACQRERVAGSQTMNESSRLGKSFIGSIFLNEYYGAREKERENERTTSTGFCAFGLSYATL